MKKIRIILLIGILFLLTGCSGTYTLKIDENLSIEENVDLVLEEKGDTYERTVSLFENNNVPKENYKIVSSKENVKINYKNKYESFEDYVANSKIYRNLFSQINYSNNSKQLIVNANTKMSASGIDDDLLEVPYLVNEYDFSLLQINLETSFDVLEDNSDNSYDNITSWTINKDTTEKDISFTLNIDKKHGVYKEIIVLFIMGAIIIGTLVIIFRGLIKRRTI